MPSEKGPGKSSKGSKKRPRCDIRRYECILQRPCEDRVQLGRSKYCHDAIQAGSDSPVSSE